MKTALFLSICGYFGKQNANTRNRAGVADIKKFVAIKKRKKETMAKKRKATISHYCQVCEETRIGEYSHSDEYFHYYFCTQEDEDEDEVSHTFYVQTKLGKALDVTRNTAGMVVIGKTGQVIYKKVSEKINSKRQKSNSDENDELTDEVVESKNEAVTNFSEELGETAKEEITEEATKGIIENFFDWLT